MKKLICLLLAMAMVFAIVGCAKETAPEEPAAEKPAATEEPVAEEKVEEPAEEGYEIAMITDVGTIDDKSFNQGTWEGVAAYAEANNVSHKYYKPIEKTTAAYTDAIDLAVKAGAKVVVTPGFLFGEAITAAQDAYPEVSFIGVDFSIEEQKENVYSALYKEQEAGFLAGYAAVKEGYTKLGFAGGMPFPAVVNFGYGFVAGADYAAQEMGVEGVEVKYTYLGGFGPDPEYQTKAATWYQGGTEVIFAAAGGAGNSVMAAAEAEGGKVIGVDIDQAPESETVITSAMKGLSISVYDALTDYYAGEFKGGKAEFLGADVNGVGLPMETSRFETFTQEDYDAIFDALATDKDGISTNIPTNASVESADAIEVSSISVEVIGE